METSENRWWFQRGVGWSVECDFHVRLDCRGNGGVWWLRNTPFSDTNTTGVLFISPYCGLWCFLSCVRSSASEDFVALVARMSSVD